jgi:hypothetical protein
MLKHRKKRSNSRFKKYVESNSLLPIIEKFSPTEDTLGESYDGVFYQYHIGQIFINTCANKVYILNSIVNNKAEWIDVFNYQKIIKEEGKE